MAGLRQLQHKFAIAITGDDYDVFTEVFPGGRLSAEGALAVYANGYTARLTEALGENFEAVWRVLGDALFFKISKEYIRCQPSMSYNLSDYGLGFPAFLGSRAELSGFPFLRALAQFEWTFKELFHQREEPAAAPALLARSQGSTRFEFVASHRLLSHGYKIYSIWKLRAAADATLPDYSGGERLLLSKKGGEIYAAELSAEEFALLESLKAGSTVEESLEKAMAKYPGLGPSAVTRLFSILSEAGIVRTITSA